MPMKARGALLLADNDEPELTADMVRSMVAAKWPGLLDSPLGQAMHGASAMAQLEASDADDAIARHEHAQMRSAALEHALLGVRGAGLRVKGECARLSDP